MAFTHTTVAMIGSRIDRINSALKMATSISVDCRVLEITWPNYRYQSAIHSVNWISSDFWILFCDLTSAIFIIVRLSQLELEFCCLKFIWHFNRFKDDICNAISELVDDFDDHLHFANGHAFNRSWILETTIQWQHFWKAQWQQHRLVSIDFEFFFFLMKSAQYYHTTYSWLLKWRLCNWA